MKNLIKHFFILAVLIASQGLLACPLQNIVFSPNGGQVSVGEEVVVENNNDPRDAWLVQIYDENDNLLDAFGMLSTDQKWKGVLPVDSSMVGRMIKVRVVMGNCYVDHYYEITA